MSVWFYIHFEFLAFVRSIFHSIFQYTIPSNVVFLIYSFIRVFATSSYLWWIHWLIHIFSFTPRKLFLFRLLSPVDNYRTPTTYLAGIRNYLIENDFLCHSCKEKTSPDNIIPNKSVRKAVENFKNTSHRASTGTPPSTSTQSPSVDTTAKTEAAPVETKPKISINLLKRWVKSGRF